MLFGNRAFADINKLRISREITLDLGWALNLVTGVLKRGGEDKDTHRGEDNVKTEAGFGEMFL